MPITPFHFGLGGALHASAPKHISFIAFCTTNVLIDLEPLYNLIHHRYPVHAFLHTYLGATLVIIGTVGLFIALQRFARAYWLPNIFDWMSLSVRQVGMGAALGSYSHILLDSVMHHDIRPLAPFSQENSLLGLVSVSDLQGLCVVLGVLGLVGVDIRRFLASR